MLIQLVACEGCDRRRDLLHLLVRLILKAFTSSVSGSSLQHERKAEEGSLQLRPMHEGGCIKLRAPMRV